MDNRRGRSAAVNTNGVEDGTWSLRHGSEECAELCENETVSFFVTLLCVFEAECIKKWKCDR